jgi:hypothetical protein|tara:strand:+ start:7010 stop:8050 length:1041 start_codon:yes stop_codon:yes gene_type:complete
MDNFSIDDAAGTVFKRFGTFVFSTKIHQPIKSDKIMREQLATAGSVVKRMNTGFQRIPTSYYTEINKAVRSAKAEIEEVGLPWTTTEPGEGRTSLSNGGWLVKLEEFHKLDKRLQMHEEAFHKAVERNIISLYDMHVKDGLRVYKGLTGHDMTEEQSSRHYPDISEVKESFLWKVEALLLNDPSEQINNVDSVLRGRWGDLLDRMHKAAHDQNRNGVKNLINGLVGSVVEMASDQVANIAQYDPESENKRNGNPLPYKNTWEKLPEMASDLVEWEKSLYGSGGPMHEVSKQLTELHDRLVKLSGNNMDEVRSILGGEDSAARDEVSDRLKSINKSASFALGDLLDD